MQTVPAPVTVTLFPRPPRTAFPTPDRTVVKPAQLPVAPAPKTTKNGGAGRRCSYCNRRLSVTTAGNLCGNSCRVQLSKLKRRLADTACQTAFPHGGWRPGDGEQLIERFGLPRVEAVLNRCGWVWSAETKQWVKTAHQGEQT